MKFKHNSIFANIQLKPLVSEEKDKYLSLASINNLRKFLPEVDSVNNIDLLPVAFDACVVNRINKNGDVIDSATATKIVNNFINKPINIEHDRSRVVGVILTANFSKFSESEPLEAKDVENIKEPFNITLGGVIWKIVDSNLTETIEDSNDPSSENYMKISASWELGFNEYNIVALDQGKKNLEDAIFIKDEKEIEKIRGQLRAFGGSGKMDNGKYIYRQVLGEVIPLGIGLTTQPAADVKGVATPEQEPIAIKIKSSETLLEEEPAAIKEDDEENNISQNELLNVDNNGDINRIIMKIDNINQITDELLKQVKASSVTEFIAEEIKKASESFVAERTEKDNAIKAAHEKYEVLSTESEKVKEELNKVKEVLSALEAEKVAKEKEEAFNTRMTLLDEEYDLSEDDRQVLASDIKDLNEEAFAAYMKKMAVLMKEKNKKNKKAKEDKEVKASVVVETSASATEVVEEVIENGALEKASMPNSSTPNEQTVKEKYAKAFGLEGFEIK
jgi:hypothetical protein